jgi:hypothetical protein
MSEDGRNEVAIRPEQNHLFPYLDVLDKRIKIALGCVSPYQEWSWCLGDHRCPKNDVMMTDFATLVVGFGEC